MSELKKIMKMKSLRNVNLVGELLKEDLITHNVILKCFSLLIDKENQDEEKLEYLCKLMAATGKELESRNIDLNSVFIYIKDIFDNKTNPISEGTRDMLLEVIRLRDNNWVPPYNEIKITNSGKIKGEKKSENKNTPELDAKNKSNTSELSSSSQDTILLSENGVTAPNCSTNTFEVCYLKEIIESKNEIIRELKEHIKLLKEKISDETKLKEHSHDDKCI